MTLILVVHGTRDPAGVMTAESLAGAVAARAGVDVALAFADVRSPGIAATVAEAGANPVVVPAFLAGGYHVRIDVPEQIRRSGRPDVMLARPLGPRPGVVEAAADRLREGGLRHSDSVVLAAAGSSDPHALADVRRAATRLAAVVRRPVRIGYIATGRPTVAEVVAGTPGRVAVASWLLAPGQFHRRLADTGAAVISEPLGIHPLVVTELVARYRAALRRRHHRTPA